ncbi:MAG: archease [Candidatus Nanoarchaeia archaeon]
MGTYKFLPHTADEKFLVKASSLEDGFATCVQAFYEILLGKDIAVKKSTTQDIALCAKKKESLLYDFLNELVFLLDESDLLLPVVEELVIEEKNGSFYLRATLAGDKRFDYALLTEIKNMTYSEMNILEHEDKSCQLTVVVDI